MNTMLDAFESEFSRKIGEIERIGMDYKTDPEFKFIEVDIALNSSIRNGLAIVDIETTGINPNRNKIVTFGILEEGYMRIIQRANCSNDEFKALLKTFVADLPMRGIHTIYAYNCGFEKRFLLSSEVDFKEIMPYRVSKDNCIHFDHFGFGVGRDVPRLWHRWEKSKNLDDLRDIMKHNANCLLKEFAIFIVNYSNYVDEAL